MNQLSQRCRSGKRLLSIGAAAFTLMVAAGPSPASDGQRPPRGSFGFDWLHPRTARCTPVADIKLLPSSRCDFKADGNAFGLQYPYFECRARKGVEYLVYLTKAACMEAKETMDANAP